MSNKRFWSTAFTVVLACGVAAPVLAEEQDVTDLDLMSLLDTPVTTAAKRPQALRQAPATVYVVTEADIRTRGYQDLMDALKDLPGFYSSAVHSENGNNRFNVRGVAGNEKIALLLNGRRISFAARSQKDFQYTANFPLANVKRIEVAYGPSSALYGADAVSATINVVTREAGDKDRLSVTGSYGLLNTTSDLISYDTKVDGDTSLSVMGRYYRTDGPNYELDPLFQNSLQNRSYWPGSKTRDASLGSDNQLISYRHKGFSVDYMRSHINAPAVGAGNDVNYASASDNRWISTVNSFNLGYESQFGEVHAVTTVAYENYELDPSSKYSFNPIATPTTTDPASRSLYLNAYKYASTRGARAEQTFIRTFSDDLNLVGGLTLEDFNGVPKTTDLPRPMDPNRSITDQGFDPIGINYAQYQNYGAYLQTELGFIPNVKTTLGARYDYNTRYKDTFNPRAGMVWTLSDALTLKALYGSAFLAPSLYDNYNVWGLPGQYMAFPNPNQRPQRFKTSEVSAIYAPNPGLVLTGTVFQNDLTDILMDKQTTQVVAGKTTFGQTIDNVGSVITRGADLRADSVVFGQRAYLGVSLVDANSTTPGSEGVLPDIVNTMVKGGVDYRPLSWLTIAPRVLWYSGRTTTKGNSLYHGDLMPSNWNLDMNVRADVTPQCAVTLTGTNLLDQAAYSNSEEWAFTLGTKQPLAGRRVLLGVSYTF